MSAILAALRLSRREIGRARGRSALIMVMIGLPVMLLTAGLTWQATGDVTLREGLDWNIGTADAHVRGTAFDRPVRQGVDAENFRLKGRGLEQRALTEREVLTLFGPGSRAVPLRGLWTGYETSGAYREADLWEIDLHDPITAGMYTLRSGRLPRVAGEVVVSAGLRLREGRTLTPAGTSTVVTVVGVVESGRAPENLEIVAPPGTVFDDTGKVGTSWLVDTPAPVSWQRVREINQHGVRVLSRAVVNDPPPAGDGPRDPLPYGSAQASEVVMVALGAVVVVLEVVFLAGPAFAVGIRRRRRELALIAAQGASPRHLRGVVLADGLTLGLAASLLGAAGGIGIGAAVAPFAHRGPLEVPVGLIALAVLLGVVSALLAAIVPAVQASRADVAEVLAGRRGRARERRGLPVLGVALLVVAMAFVLLGAAFARRWVQYGAWQPVSLLLGAVLGQLGLVLLTPWLVGVAARLAARSPLPFRMAARDAVRNSGRTAPAVAAVLVATAVFATAAVMVSSQTALVREHYLPQYVRGSTVVSSYAPEPAAWREIRRVVTSALPGVPLIEAGRLAGPDSQPVNVVVQPGCGRNCEAFLSRASFHPPPVGGADLVRYFLRGPDPAAEAALAEGKAVVFDPRVLREGKLVFTTKITKRVTHSVPAVVRRPRGEPLVTAVLPVSLAAELGLTVDYNTLIADPAAVSTTPQQEERLHAAVREVNSTTAAEVERGFRDDDTATLLAFAAAAAVLVLGGTFAATGLAVAEGRPDRATLAAVGAAGRVQRLLVAGQAAFVSGLGVGAGMFVGLVAGVASVLGRFYRQWAPGSTAMDRVPPDLVTFAVDAPWLLLGGVLVGLPLLTALLAGSCVRTRVVLTRRLT
ncbi:FtsX-like permease family protein [Streptosporangium sp. NPDC002721]|uniref:FtsX-like permease family protein n=1 Tax=Streptosporangium sp. NPDC002721 TaxID=3366188 RepID=UPI00369C442E